MSTQPNHLDFRTRKNVVKNSLGYPVWEKKSRVKADVAPLPTREHRPNGEWVCCGVTPATREDEEADWLMLSLTVLLSLRTLNFYFCFF